MPPLSRARTALRRRTTLIALTVLLAIGGSIAIAAPASAATVWAYGEAVIMVDPGSKNFSNHTQYVSSITVEDPGTDVCDGGTYEAWAGTVWYSSRVICSASGGGTMNVTTFYVGTWVPSGSGVCGSFWRYDSHAGWTRRVACISITV